jgi:hypothetical protein
MLEFLRRPYGGSETNRNKLISILVFGLFIFLFLYLFKPFGMTGMKPMMQLLSSFGFGLITTFVLVIFKFLIEPLVIKGNWTIGKNILWDIIIASSIGSANYFYICILFDMDFQVRYLLFSIWAAILVGSIPVTITYFIAFNRRYKTVLREASIPDEVIYWEDEVTITAGNPRNDFKCNPKVIAYLCSNDNYVTIVTIRDNVQTKTTIRGTLKSAEEELRKNSRFIRCHKCYLVNLDYVEKVSGSNQNMKLILSASGAEIPVARSRADEVASRMVKR